MSGFTDLFGGGTLQAADVSYAAIAMVGDTETFWPPAAVGSAQALPRLADVTADAPGYTLYLPDATEVSAGQDFFCFNAGADAFTVADYSGSALAVMAPGVQRYFYLRDNATAGGTWRSILMGVGAASNDASQLAGLGLKAIGASLNQAASLSIISTSSLFGATDRGKVFVNSGGSITATLPLTSDTNVGSDFFLELRNQGTGAVTVSPTGGELIDGSASIALNINESCFVHSGTGAWYTVGRGRNAQFNFTQLVKAVTGGSDVLSLTEASNVVQTYTGVLTSNEVVTLPAVVQVYYISNQTSGAFSFTLQTAGGGTTLGLPTGQNAVVFCDGTNVINASTSIGGISALLLNSGTVAAPSLAIGATNNGLFAPTTTSIAVSAGGVEAIQWNTNGQGLAANGAAALPAYSFKVSPSTGVYSPGADILGLATAGVLRLSVSAAGVVTPGADNTQNLGSGALRWATVYGTSFTGNAATATTAATAVTATNVSGTVAVANGGTGATTAAGARTNLGVNVVDTASKSADYTLTLTDVGIYHPASDANTRTFTIDGALAYPVGTALTFFNLSANTVNLAITTDTMYMAGLGTTGTRSLAQFGIATAVKLASGEWLVSGTNLS